MAFLPLPDSNEVVEANFVDLAVNFETPKAEAISLLNSGLTMDEIREYKRSLNNCGTYPIQ